MTMYSMKWRLLCIRDHIELLLVTNKVTRPFIEKSMAFKEWCQEHQWVGEIIKWSVVAYLTVSSLMSVLWYHDPIGAIVNVIVIAIWFIPFDRGGTDNDEDDDTMYPDPTPKGAAF